MARLTTLRDRIKTIIRRYKKINKQKFLYNSKRDLNARFNRILVWWLINNPDTGYSIMRMEFKRKPLFTVKQWHTLFESGLDTPERHYDSLYTIFTQAVLPAINVGGTKWRFISLLAWTAAIDDLRQTKNSKASRKRHQKSKKGNANARRGNRSR